LPPVSAQNCNAIAVRLLIVVAGDDFFFPKKQSDTVGVGCEPAMSFLGNTPVRTSGASYALGNVNADFGIRG
jgi:hypothetical protein